MSITARIKQVAHDWGGSTAIFFAYTHASHDLCPALLVPLLPFIKESMGLNYLQAALLLSAYSITAGISQLPGGWLGDHFSKRAVLTFALASVGLTCMVIGLVSSYVLLLALLVVWGMFAGIYHPSVVPVLSNHFEVKRRGKVIGLHMVGGSAGYSLAPIFGGLIAGWLMWPSAFLILGVPALVAAVLLLRNVGIRESLRPRKYQPAGGASVKKLSLWQVLRPIALLFTVVILIHFVASLAIAFLPVYLVDKHHLEPTHAAVLTGMLRFGGVVGSLFGGWLSDRWGRNRAVLLGLTLTGPMLYLLTALPFNSLLIVVMAFSGIIMFMRQSTFQPFLMDSTPAYLRATVFGIYFGLGMEGASILQPAAGQLMDVFGLNTIYNMIAYSGLALSAVTLLLSRVLSRTIASAGASDTLLG
ncbi:MAG: MFS transporter [Chloroflexota bacterium]